MAKKIILAFTSGALGLAGFWAFYLLLWSAPAGSVSPEFPLFECKTSYLGPLRIVDCGSFADGPLLVFNRFPERFLADCGFWTMGQRETLCLTVYRYQGLFTP